MEYDEISFFCAYSKNIPGLFKKAHDYLVEMEKEMDQGRNGLKSGKSYMAKNIENIALLYSEFGTHLVLWISKEQINPLKKVIKNEKV